MWLRLTMFYESSHGDGLIEVNSSIWELNRYISELTRGQ